MDANGLRFWMLSSAADWSLDAGPRLGLYYCAKTNRVQLQSVSDAPTPPEVLSAATAQVEVTPIARDRYDTYARWDPSSAHVIAGGGGAGEIPIYAPPPLEPVSDLALGYDGILYMAVGGALVMLDRRGRWPQFTLTVPDFTFWRLCALPEGGVLALDRSKPQLGKVTGQPLQTGPADVPAPGILRSCDPNPDPPRVAVRYPLPANETFVALTAMGGAQFALLSWQIPSTNGVAFLRTFAETGGAGAPVQLDGVKWPYAIAWIGDQRVAAITVNFKEAPIFDLATSQNAALPMGETYVLSDENAGPFAHAFDLPAYYAVMDQNPPALMPLLPLSLNSFAPSGTTDPAAPKILDSGASQTVWHRLFLEAIVPPRCGMLVWLAASDTASDLTSMATRWYPHVVGEADLSGIPADAPNAVWQSILPEVPFAPALLNVDPVPDRQGLFMVLLQRAGKAVRNVQGRYLGVRLQMNGDGRNTPELAALRLYASRFSYVEHYLPAVYHEDAYGAEAERDGQSTRRDFLERFVDLFEAQLTRIEDRVANAYLVTRPESAPDTALEWLGGWVGIEPSGYPPARRRARLLATPQLYDERGTADGVTLALDVATDGMCTRGAIIVIEDFRLRHIFATILGADLSIQNDPLLPGYSASSNSFVGDTLFLGDPRIQAELQALYATNLNLAGGAQAAEALYDSLANRMTVFVHDQVETVDMLLVQRLVEREKPAHVAASVVRASQAFMIGLASLVGVNTYLAPEPPRNTVTLDVSDVGRYDVVTNMPVLDPRAGGGDVAAWSDPIARLSGPKYVLPGGTIQLDGSASTPPPGERIVTYQWTLLPS